LKEPLVIRGMHVGEQFIHTDEQMTFCRQMGVEYIDGVPSSRKPGDSEGGYGSADILARLPKKSDSGEENYWTAEALSMFREHVESFGLKLAAMHLSLQASNLGSFALPSILMGTPDRDRDIEKVCRFIEAAGAAGIPLILYSLNITGTVRNPGWVFGRGGSMHHYFDYDRLGDAPPHPAAPISAEQTWERIAYFIERVIPVAEECKVRMACHPSDPAMPKGSNYRGIERVLDTVEDLKHLIEICPSDYHGINFCQGCISQSCSNPEEVYDAIRYFGSRNKIFWVHFRNIKGGYLKFEETFPDEGDIDMVKAMRTYKEVGYNGVLIPDHVPQLYLDTMWGHQAHAFAIGYIKALIQAVESEK